MEKKLIFQIIIAFIIGIVILFIFNGNNDEVIYNIEELEELGDSIKPLASTGLSLEKSDEIIEISDLDLINETKFYPSNFYQSLAETGNGYNLKNINISQTPTKYRTYAGVQLSTLKTNFSFPFSIEIKPENEDSLYFPVLYDKHWQNGAETFENCTYEFTGKITKMMIKSYVRKTSSFSSYNLKYVTFFDVMTTPICTNVQDN